MKIGKKTLSRRIFLKIGAALAATLGFAGIGGGWYVSLPKFGAVPKGRRLQRVLASPNWDGAKFENYEPIVNVVKDTGKNDGFLTAMKEIVFPTKGKGIPENPIPTVKTDLNTVSDTGLQVIWMGHSSCFLRINGKNILIDPVFSTYASPVPYIVKAFEGTEIYSSDDMPEIDYLLLSHDHWDHLDYPAIIALKDKVKNVVCPLGVDGHLIGWGYQEEMVHELDWFESVQLGDTKIHLTPSRHFSGRFLKRNQTLWGGFVIEAAGKRVYYTGDGGMGNHFKTIAEHFPQGMDLVLLENGQYDDNWHDVHMFSEEGAEVAQIVGARAVVPVHAGKYNLCKSSWNMPFERLYEAYKKGGYSYKLLLPKIGEVVTVPAGREYDAWWREV